MGADLEVARTPKPRAEKKLGLPKQRRRLQDAGRRLASNQSRRPRSGRTGSATRPRDATPAPLSYDDTRYVAGASEVHLKGTKKWANRSTRWLSRHRGAYQRDRHRSLYVVSSELVVTYTR